MKKTYSSKVLLVLAFLLGLAIFIYPSLSDYLTRKIVIQEADTYDNHITQLSSDEIEQMWEEARAYNDSLNGNPVPDPFIPGSGRVLPENYLRVLDVENGIMGYVDIPNIRVYLPIRHGTSNEALEKGAGHIEQTSLPIGGLGNHSILTAHTGLVGAEMFNRLIELKQGDTFQIHVLEETFTYEVDNIHVILPEEIERLLPVAGEDYVTLVTCTPYGVNSHRLLVRGTRVENIEDTLRVREKAAFPWKVLLIMVVALIFIGVLVWKRRQEKEERDEIMKEMEQKRSELVMKIERKREERWRKMKKR
jgi:LPXTG-site transpeptidase (sortase) family protein